MRKPNDSLETILTILETLEDSEEVHSIRRIEERSGIPKSTVHRILQELTSIGWAYQDEEDKNYYVGLKFLSLANEWRSNIEVVKAFDPILRQVVNACGQTAFLNIIDGERAVCLHKVESNNAVRIASIIGQEQPFHAGASGKLLLAYAPELLIKKVLSEKLEAFTPFTRTDPATLMDELKDIRKQGYSESMEEMDPGVAAISVHVDWPDAVIALTVAGIRFDYERDRESWLSALTEATKK